jgi:hypothetical protein
MNKSRENTKSPEREASSPPKASIVKEVKKKTSPLRRMKTKKDGPSGGIFMGGMN